MQVEWRTDDLLSLTYRIEDGIDEIHLPARQPSQHTDGLWRSTCFEAFMRAPGERSYLEINVSPSTQWAVYRFADYRRGMQALTPKHPPQIVCRRREDGLEADVALPLASLGLGADGQIELGLATVLQDRHGELSYWALSHPAANPDFHHPKGFLLTLSRPRQ